MARCLNIKIVISGPLQSGKSTYVRRVDQKSLNVEARGSDNQLYTVGMDLGSIKLNGFDVFLFGTPGLLRFSVMRDVVVDGADGLVYIFDASNPASDEEAIIILNQVRKILKPNTPIVFLANKSDLPEARSPEAIKEINKLPDCKIFAASTKTGLNIEESLKYIVNEVFNKYKETLAIMRDFETNIRGLAVKLNMDKEQTRDFLNNLEIKRFIEIDRIKRTYKVREGLQNLT